ncbi:MAG: phage tail tape measure protein, partial [Clostridium sp.]
NKLVNATTKMNNTEKAMLQNQKALEDVNKEISNSKIDKLAENFDKVSEASGKASDKLKPVSTAIAGLGTASIAASITFEDSMAKVSTIADETEVSYDSMKKSIIDLSDQTGISANDIADNVYNAISAGQSTADAVNFVTESTKLAKAGFAEAGQSLDILTTILNAYGLEASEVTNVSDILVQTQNKGKTTVAELASSMGKIIPTANSVNVNLEQLGTGYALMTAKGIATAETTTYMNSMLNELSDSGSTVASILKEKTGKSFAELMESGTSLGDAMAIIEQKANNSGLAMSELWSSSEAGKAALVLATDAGQAFNSTLSDMQNSAGATDTAFEKVNNTTGNKLKQSLNEVKNSAINMGDTLAPATSMVAEGFSKITGMLSNLSSEQLKTIAGIGAGVVTLNVAVGAFSKLTKGISDTVKAYKDIKEFGGNALDVVKSFSNKSLEGARTVGSLALNLGKSTVELAKSTTQFVAHKAVTIASTVATTAMSAAQAALNFVMSLNPITLIIIAIGALVAAIVVLWNKCEWFRELCYSLFEGLKQAWNTTLQFFKSCWDWFTGLWNTSIEGIKNIWQGLCNTIKSVWEGIVNNIKSSWNGFKSIFVTVGDSIRSVWNGLTSMISSVWNGVVNGIKSAWNGIISPFQSVVTSITRIWDGIKSMFKLPHFSITGKFSLVPPSIPKVSVDWYYNGGIFKSPTVLGGIGVGDAFNGQGSNAEAIVPLDEMYRNIKGIVDNSSEGNIVIYLTNTTKLDSEVISSKTTKKVIKGIGKEKSSRKILSGGGKLKYV